MILRIHQKESDPNLSKNCSIPTVLSLDNGDTIIDLCNIPNTFNNYFALIAKFMKKTIKHLYKHFSD